MYLIKKGDVISQNNRTYAVYLRDIKSQTKLSETNAFRIIVDALRAINTNPAWTHIHGRINDNVIYYKIAKPTFKVKPRYGWSLRSVHKIIEARHLAPVGGPHIQKDREFVYLGNIANRVNLDTIELMINHNEPIGQDILWKAILELNQIEDFKTI